MRIRSIYLFSGLLLSTFIFSSLITQAQPTEPPLVPIDGGVSFLIAAGALYGAKKVYDYTKGKSK